MTNKEKEEKIIIKIELPKTLYEKIKEFIRDSEWKTVEDFALYVLKRVISEAEGSEEEEEVYTKEEEEEIKRRLRALGYL
mgnify:FL=1